jgi:hypothetical protein
MTPWTRLKEGVRFARHRDLQLCVRLLASGRWHASVQPKGACAVCLGDNFPTAHAAMRAAEVEAGEVLPPPPATTTKRRRRWRRATG